MKINRDSRDRIRVSPIGVEGADEKADLYFRDQKRKRKQKSFDKSDFVSKEDLISLKNAFLTGVGNLSSSVVSSLSYFSRHIYRRLGPIGIFIVIVALLFSGLFISFVGSGSNIENPDDGRAAGVSTDVSSSSPPPFSPPSAKGLDTSKAKYDPERKVISYVDTLEGSEITLSFQELEPQQINDPTFLSTAAESFSLSVPVDSDKGEVYIGDNSRNNVQIAVFLYNDLLSFIQTRVIYDVDTLVEYINALQ